VPEQPRGLHAASFVALALDIVAEDPLVDDSCVQAIIEAFRQLPIHDDLPLEDVLTSATALCLHIWRAQQRGG